MALTTNINWLDRNVFNMDEILAKSEEIFCSEQLVLGGDDLFLGRDENVGLARQFLDSAPSGQYGTLTYISRAIAVVLSG